ncbi:MAG: prephenate/arogenate dehydrogenase family protein, partial [Thermoleophilia bacterium]
MRLAVIGTGLIGASVGLAAKRGGATVVGFDADRPTAEVAAERGAVHEVAGTLGEALREAELAVVA